MPHTRGEGDGKNCVFRNAYMLFVIADFRFPVAVVHTLSPLVLSGPQNVPCGGQFPRSSTSINIHAFVSQFSYSQLQFSILASVRRCVAGEGSFEDTLTYLLGCPAVYSSYARACSPSIMQAHFWARHIRKVPNLVACTPLKMT